MNQNRKSQKHIVAKRNKGFFEFIAELANLRLDTDRAGTIEAISANVEFRSANAWTLVFAIMIASVGLNLSSTAVIIGAMLISPLMGPIVGIGFALGTNDFMLLKKSAKTLAAAVLLSILASTLYFLISPVYEVQSELLARTRPSFYDVIIAFFGGAAGIVAISRKEKVNIAVAGVAIATALMPPLCTAGFGLATRNWSYFYGALYLFLINTVFISISTFVFVRSLKFDEVVRIGIEQKKIIKRWIVYVGIIVLIPSFFMAWYLQRENLFKVYASNYIRNEFPSAKYFVVEKTIEFSLKSPKIRILLLGNGIKTEEVMLLKQKAAHYSLKPESVEIHQSSYGENLEGEKAREKENEMSRQFSASREISDKLELKVRKTQEELASYNELEALSVKLTKELAVIFPGMVSRVIVVKALATEAKLGITAEPVNPIRGTSALIQWRFMPNKTQSDTAIEFLGQRLDLTRDRIVQSIRF